jgi:DNA polymerase-3 subunit alpha
MINGKFVSLHNHTELGSPLDGMNRVDEIFARAKEIDHPALAITDHGTLTAHYDCWKESKKTGIKFIPGCEFYFSDNLESKKTNHMVLLAANATGYKNILRLNYEAYKNQTIGYMGKATPRISWEHISNYNDGVICLTACSNGLIAKTLITENDEQKALCYIDKLNSIFINRFYLEIQPHNLRADTKNGGEVNQKRLNEAMIRISHDKHIPYVITCDAHYKDKDHAKYHDFMLAIKDKKSVDDPDRFRYGVQDMYLKEHSEIEDFFGKDISELGMKNSMLIAERCEVPTYLEPKGPMLPKFPVEKEKNYFDFSKWKNKTCKDVDDDKAYLRFKCLNSFKEKFKDSSKEEKEDAWTRVKKEL